MSRNQQSNKKPPCEMNTSKYMTTISSCDRISVDDARKIFEQAMNDAILATYKWPERPSSDGYYHVQIEDATKKSGRRQIKAKTLEGLQQKVLDHQREKYDGTRKTFLACFELAMQRKLHFVKDPEKLISAKNTVSVLKSTYQRFFTGTDFEKMYVDDIRKKDIENFCDQILHRMDLTKKAFDSMRGVLSLTMKYAYSEIGIIDNPYDRVDFNMFKGLLIETKAVSERVHTEEEVEMMLDYIHEYQTRKPHYVPAYALELQILMGLRRAEVAPLTWSDVHEDQYISITKEQLTDKESKKCVVVNHTKTHVSRQFPQTTAIQEFLERYRIIQNTYFPGSDYLFPSNSTETGIINNKAVYNFYSRMCKKLGITISRECIKGPHSFRRNGITKVTNNSGGDFVLASQMYGNSPMTAKKHYYTGADIEKGRIALEGPMVNKKPLKVNKGKQVFGLIYNCKKSSNP